MRTVRDTAAAHELRELCSDGCQVCGHALEGGSGRRRSEAHHLLPFHEGGHGEQGNIVALCVRRHVELDYGAIRIGGDGAVRERRLRGQEAHVQGRPPARAR